MGSKPDAACSEGCSAVALSITCGSRFGAASLSIFDRSIDMKRSTSLIFQTMVLAVILLVFLMGGSFRAQNSAQANSTAVPQNRVNSSESISSWMFNGKSANYFDVRLPFANGTETS